jgi:DNA mismatch repair protein MLH1
VQHQTGLFMMNVTRIGCALLWQLLALLFNMDCSQCVGYQRVLELFSNFSELTLDPPAPCRDLLRVVCSDAVLSAGKDEAACQEEADAALALLMSRRELLEEYFSMRFDADSGNLLSLPSLWDGHRPNMDRLPAFLAQLAQNVCKRGDV